MHRLDVVWKTGDYNAKVEPFNKHAQSTNVWLHVLSVMIECKRGRQHEFCGLISVTMLCQFFLLVPYVLQHLYHLKLRHH